jgi:hypothetical protein
VGSAAAGGDITEAPPTISKVKLKIVTKPQHALVKLNGAELGRTPLDVDVAPVDTAALEISADGYDRESRSLALITDQTLDIALSKKASSGNRPPAPRPRPPKTGSATANSPPPDSDLDIRMHR